MKLFGTLAELVKIAFRKGSKEVLVEPATQSGSGPVTFTLPDAGSNSATVAIRSDKLSAFAATSSSELAGVISDETGSGKLVFNDSPTLAGNILLQNAPGANQPQLQLSEDPDFGTNKINLQAPTALGSDYTLTLPNTLPAAASVLDTDTSGNTSWVRYTSTNTNSAIVQRDASGNFSAGTITASLSGNATTATTAGNVSGTVAIANGGTGQTTQQAALNALAGATTANRVLRGDGTNISLSQVDLTTDVTGILPAANGGTGLSSLGSGVATFLGTPSSANLAGAITDETGSGSLVFGTSPTLSSPQVNSALTIQQIATPSNPSSGFNKIYTKSDGLLYKLDSAGNEVLVGSGTGGGELNLVLNPDGDTALDGNRTNDVGDWVDFGTGTTSSRTTTAAEIPLSPLKTNAIKILNDNSGTGYTYMRMTLPPSLYNRKLKIAWEQEVSTSPAYASGDFKVELYANAAADYSGAYTRINLSTDSSSVSAIPALTGRYQTSFDTTTAANLELRIVRVAGTNSSFLALNNVIVGPGIQPQGAVIGEWTSFTPTVTASGGGTVSFGTGGSVNQLGRYRRVGTNAEIEISVRWGTSGTSFGTSGFFIFALPASLTVSTSSLPISSSIRSVVGSGEYVDDSTGQIYGFEVTVNDSGQIAATLSNSSSGNLGTLTPVTVANSDYIMMQFTVPIAEWAGSGTVQLAQNDVEYASNSSTSDADELTSFAYGPSGSLIPTITSAATPNNRKKRVQFASSIQAGDIISIEVQLSGTGAWIPVSSIGGTSYGALSYQSGGQYGLGWSAVSGSSTQIDVEFGKQGPRGNPAAYSGISPTNYPVNSGDRWRVRKTSAGAAVGFGIVQPGTSAGLVSASGLPGKTSGTAIASGYVGETSFQSATNTTGSTTVNTYTNVTGTDVTLTAGVWLVVAHASLASATVSGGSITEEISLFNVTDTTTVTAVLGGYAGTGSQTTVQGVSFQQIINISSGKTYRLRHRSVTFGGSPTISSGATVYGTLSSNNQTRISYVRIA